MPSRGTSNKKLMEATQPKMKHILFSARRLQDESSEARGLCLVDVAQGSRGPGSTDGNPQAWCSETALADVAWCIKGPSSINDQ